MATLKESSKSGENVPYFPLRTHTEKEIPGFSHGHGLWAGARPSENPTAKIAFRVKGVAKATNPKYYPAPAPPPAAREKFAPLPRRPAPRGRSRIRNTFPKHLSVTLPILSNMATQQETLDDSETVQNTAPDGTRLVEHDDGSGSVLERYDDPDYGTVDERYTYDKLRDARLHFGLYLRVGGFHRPERGASQMVPTNIAVDGKPAIAAWLYLKGAYGHVGTRRSVADRMNVTEHTVSKYLSTVRDISRTA